MSWLLLGRFRSSPPVRQSVCLYVRLYVPQSVCLSQRRPRSVSAFYGLAAAAVLLSQASVYLSLFLRPYIAGEHLR